MFKASHFCLSKNEISNLMATFCIDNASVPMLKFGQRIFKQSDAKQCWLISILHLLTFVSWCKSEIFAVLLFRQIAKSSGSADNKSFWRIQFNFLANFLSSRGQNQSAFVRTVVSNIWQLPKEREKDTLFVQNTTNKLSVNLKLENHNLIDICFL